MMCDVLMVGDRVDCVIGSQFLPNQQGAPIHPRGRRDGEVIAWNQYGTADVRWPSGEVYSYESALLRKRGSSGSDA